jgi:hypothetical protein
MPDNSIVRLQAGQHGGLALLSAIDSDLCMAHHAPVGENVLTNNRMRGAGTSRELLAGSFIYRFCGLPCLSRLVVLYIRHRFSAD